MAKKFLLNPAGVCDLLQKRYQLQCRHWLLNETQGKNTWPQSIPLGLPTEQQALSRITEVREWQTHWQHWRGAGEVQWTQRRWKALGSQNLPERFIVDLPETLADIIGLSEQWACAKRRFQELIRRWPQLKDVLPGNFEVLANWSDAEFQHLMEVVNWLDTHRGAGLYIRQVPIPGTDSKWLETRHKLITRWLSHILGQTEGGDLYQLTGMRRLPLTLRLRLLDPALRAANGGLSDIQAPVNELAQWRLPVKRVFIVENLQTGLAFEDLPDSLVFMKQGYAVDLLGQLPWLKDVPCYYWGDIDSDGFAILDRLRHYLPQARSLLMDRQTLLKHRDCWSTEPQTSNVQLQRLTTEEKLLLDEMRQAKYGSGVRLEQERIGWDYAWEFINHCH
tara:strand:+ start:48555 stop:49727 length:1173 start_codon:yes stop_codon:yes gene_type:complete